MTEVYILLTYEAKANKIKQNANTIYNLQCI
jgi:hypothetical protein